MEERKKYYVPAWVQRFDNHQRWQHLLLAVSVLMLMITGFPMKYAYTWWAPYVMSVFGGFKNMLTVHKIFAVLMIVSGIYHLIWLLVKMPLMKKAKWAIFPSQKDIRDAYDHAKYLMGLGEMPKYHRYAYLEKFEYFAVVWGIIIMGITGAVLWFPDLAVAFLPRWIISIFRVVHSFEALVCLIAIVIGHFYSVHLNPDVFPTSPVWIDGKISRNHLAHEHPLEYEEIAAENMEKGKVFADEVPKQVSGKFKDSIALKSVLFVVYVGIFAWIMISFIPNLFIFN